MLCEELPRSSSCSSLSAAFSSLLCWTLTSRRFWNLGREHSAVHFPKLSIHWTQEEAEVTPAHEGCIRKDPRWLPLNPRTHRECSEPRRPLQSSKSGVLSGCGCTSTAHRTMSGDVLCGHNVGGRGVLLAPRGWRSGMLLNALQCTEWPPPQRISCPKCQLCCCV